MSEARGPAVQPRGASPRPPKPAPTKSDLELDKLTLECRKLRFETNIVATVVRAGTLVSLAITLAVAVGTYLANGGKDRSAALQAARDQHRNRSRGLSCVGAARARIRQRAGMVAWCQ
jgi:hypothetical protein